jgi:hypothetical protein
MSFIIIVARDARISNVWGFSLYYFPVPFLSWMTQSLAIGLTAPWRLKRPPPRARDLFLLSSCLVCASHVYTDNVQKFSSH